MVNFFSYLVIFTTLVFTNEKQNIIDVLENRSCFIINWKKISKDKMTGISLYNKGPTWEW